LKAAYLQKCSPNGGAIDQNRLKYACAAKSAPCLPKPIGNAGRFQKEVYITNYAGSAKKTSKIKQKYIKKETQMDATLCEVLQHKTDGEKWYSYLAPEQYHYWNSEYPWDIKKFRELKTRLYSVSVAANPKAHNANAAQIMAHIKAQEFNLRHGEKFVPVKLS
jgi:phosphatidylserine decarboxylase